MRTKVILLVLILLTILLEGCYEEKTSTSYFEIVIDSNTFHEIIIVPSGEVFDKVGHSNLDFENQIKTSLIQKETALMLFEKSKELAQKGIDCEYGEKELIVFENNTINRKCFTSTNFDSFFSEVKMAADSTIALDNFFIHLITSNGGRIVDQHLHSNGLLITTNYTLNSMTNASMKKITPNKIAQLKQAINDQILVSETTCSPTESEYNYVEIQDEQKYTYYYNCPKNSSDKTNFFETAKIILGE